MKRRLIALTMAAFVTLVGCKSTPQTVPEKPSSSQEVTEEPQEATEEATETAGLPQVMIEHISKSDTYQQREETAMSISYDVVTLDDASGTAFPELQKRLQADAVAQKSRLEESYDSYLQSALEFETEQGEDWYYMQGSIDQTARIYRNDGQVLTVVVDAYGYSPGAAHGMYGTSGTNYLVATGDVLTLSDVLQGSQDALVDALQQKLLQDFPDLQESVTLQEDITSTITEEDYNGWFLSGEGVNFYFGPYTLASYAAGAFSVQLTLQEFPELLNATYFPQEDVPRVVEGRAEEGCMDFDVDGDGTRDVIRLSLQYDWETEGEAFIDTYTLQAGEKQLEESLGAKAVTPYYLSDGNGHTYIYLVSETQTEDLMITVCEADSMQVRKVGEYYGNFASDDTDDGTIRYAFCDPQHFYLDQRIDPLSTTYGRMTYQIGKDGSPEALEEAYEVTEPFTLTTLVELKVRLTEDDSEFILPAGTNIEIHSTDDATYVQGTLEDGRSVTIDCDLSWPQTVDGMEAEQVFDGIFYAG